MERGQLAKVGSFVPLNGYAPLALPEGGIDVLKSELLAWQTAPARRHA